MFLVARPTACPFTHPYAHPSGHTYEHVQAPFHLPFDSVHAYEQHIARQHHDELVHERARAAVARAQQRREYERQLAIQAVKEEIFLQHVARLRAQEEYRRELLRHERLRQVEEARRAQRQRQISAMRAAMAQQAIYAALEQALAEDPDVAMTDDTPKPTQEQPLSAPQPVSLADALHSRAQTEQDPEVLLTLNGLLQALASHSRAPSPQPTSTTQSGPISSEKDIPAPETAAAPTTAPVPIDVAPVQEPLPARPVSPALSTSSHATSIAALDAISTSLHNLTSGFVLPQVDFSTPASSTDSRPSSPSTHLSYTTANQPIHAYEAALGKLLDRLDAIDSEGNEEIRAQRKNLVLEVEEKLRQLDEAIERQRREHQIATTPEPASPAMETDMEMIEDAPVDEGRLETAAEPIADPIAPAVDADMGPMQGDSVEVDIVPEIPAPVGNELSLTESDAMEVEAVTQSAPTSNKDATEVADHVIPLGHDTHPDGTTYHPVVDPLVAGSLPTHASSTSHESDSVPSTPTVKVSVPSHEDQSDTMPAMEGDEVLVTALLSPISEVDAASDLSSGSDLEGESESTHDYEARHPETLEEDWSDVEA